MRRRLALATATFFVLAVPAHAANPQVAGLQVALRAQGLYTGAIDAITGPRTVAAVRTFQARQGLRVTGRADARTRKALGPFGRPLFGARPLRRGAFGWDVAVLQFLLIKQGLRPSLNGYFDGPTARALRRYQARMRLASDGVAGSATFAALGLQTRIPVRPTPVRKHAVAINVYVVRPGDSLTTIARKHGTTVRVLARLNKLDPSRFLIIGRRLRLPVVLRLERTAAVATDALAVRNSLDHWASVYGVDPHLARALAWMESGFQQSAHSSVGAEGVMQLLPTTWDYVETSLIGAKVPHTADGNVRVGVALLHHLLQSFNGNEKLALAAWYEGEKAVRTRGLFNETKPFVTDVLALRARM